MCCCKCNDKPKTVFEVGDIVHGFAQGYFGRDSYDCKVVEAVSKEVGNSWVVFRYLDYGDKTSSVTLYQGSNHAAIFHELKHALEKDEHCTCID
ncbi:hypothetical protein SEA_MOAB_206 [Streptomyces phage Moab]|nr:hypothetical protein SEA_MOAB_206 [Streptomyces phage Moab]WMI33810.1 hypothetical protein SEA_PATELGO_208 [Streptomyces phage Patelgo]